MNEKLITYELTIDENDDTGVNLISIVDDPAIEVKGFAFSKHNKEQFQFSTVEDKQIIVGPVMIPNHKIYRIDEDGTEYYVFYTEETIKKALNKFNKGNNNKSINLNHSESMVDAYIQESWIVEDGTYDKSKMYGYNVPIGTWFIAMKIDDKEFWNKEVKENGKCSFSIEGFMGMMETKMNKDKSIDEQIDDMTEDEIINFIGDLFK